MLLNIFPAWEQMNSQYIVLKTKRIKIDNTTTFIHENILKPLIKRYYVLLKKGKGIYAIKDDIIYFNTCN